MCHVTKYSTIRGVFQQPWPGHFERGEGPGDEVGLSPVRDGGPFWEALEDFQTDTPLHHCFLDMTPHKIKCCENDP